jgi:hypothetical protein
MTSKLIDIENLIDELTLLSQSWSLSVSHIEARVGKKSGMHHHEICLATVLRKLNSLAEANDSNLDVLRYWARITAADIVKCCLSLNIDPREHLQNSHGNFIVRPHLDGFTFYEYLALKVQLINSWEIRPVLDFNLVNGITVKPTESPSKSQGKEIPFAHEYMLLKGLEHYTRHFIFLYSFSKDETALQNLESWISSRFDRLSDPQLIEYHRYSFEEESDSDLNERGNESSNAGVTRIYNPGCSDNYLKQFLSLLKNINGAAKGLQSFVNPKLVDTILTKYFGVGKLPELDGTEGASITKHQICWFVGEFIDNRKNPNSKKFIGYKDLIEIFAAELPDSILKGKEVGTLVGNRSKYAKNGKADALDWRRHPTVKSAVESEKNV